MSLTGVLAIEAAGNRKLAPVKKVGRTCIPDGSRCSATYVSINKTCPESCTFKGNGCYAQTGYTGLIVAPLDAAVDYNIGQNEAAAILRMFGGGPIPQDGGKHGRSGRDLRLHVSGDVRDFDHAGHLAYAAERWMARGGGRVWTYTHRWRTIDRGAWGRVSVLASCETPEDATAARARGYKVALVAPNPRGATRAYLMTDIGKVLPCPAETLGTTCVQCRLCLDDKKLGVAIAFAPHGPGARKAKRRLPMLDTLFGTLP